MGQALSKSGKANEAIKYFDIYLKTDPTDIETLLQKGVADF